MFALKSRYKGDPEAVQFCESMLNGEDSHYGTWAKVFYGFYVIGRLEDGSYGVVEHAATEVEHG